MSNEEQQIDESPSAIGGNQPISYKSKAYSSAKRRLDENELMNAGALNLLIDNLDRLEDEINDLRKVKQEFHVLDKRNGVLEEKLEIQKLNEILYNLSIGFGGLFVGLAKPLWNYEF